MFNKSVSSNAEYYLDADWATDIDDRKSMGVIGTAFALNILFHIPLWCGVLLTGLSTLLLLGLQRFGIIIISWILGSGIIGINVYYLSTGFVGWLIHNSLPKVANVFIGIIVFPLMVIYIVSIIYLALRKDTIETYIEAKDDPTVQNHMEKGLMDPNNAQVELGRAPRREDLADVPFPQ
ncbi:hypothetical protein K1719_025550 [Acacia pycnantha]|nr:hypothetical protein K1719_025550 [Acacia pycnantha]